MIGFLLGNWKLVGGLAIGAAAAGYVGLLKLDNVRLEAKLAKTETEWAKSLGELQTCGARLTNILEARDSDATVDLNTLDGFVVPPEWLLDPDTPGTDSPGQ